MGLAVWRKSSLSGDTGDCVEVAEIAGVIGIRDSKAPGGPVHLISRAGFGSLIAQLKATQIE
jgi:hypothetical protein